VNRKTYAKDFDLLWHDKGRVYISECYYLLDINLFDAGRNKKLA
jgi:hypothetical protein